MVYCERVRSKSEALRLERAIKRMGRERKERLAESSAGATG
jgi:predicted GIY-YIG superfamily endonuclease